MVWSLMENLGYGSWDKYSERNLHLVERPGNEYQTPIQDDEYHGSLVQNAYWFLSALQNQKTAFKQAKTKYPDVCDTEYGLTKTKLDKILKILFGDE